MLVPIVLNDKGTGWRVQQFLQFDDEPFKAINSVADRDSSGVVLVEISMHPIGYGNMGQEVVPAEFSAKLLTNRINVGVTVMLPPSLNGYGFEGMSDRTPSLLGRLNPVIQGQFLPGLVQ